MMLYHFPDRFCGNYRPYWVLMGLFMVSNILLVYTLYTRQPERYHRLLGERTDPDLTPANETPVAGQKAAFLSAPGANVANGWSGPAFRNPAWVTGLPPAGLETFEFLGMTLGNHRPNRIGGVDPTSTSPPHYGVQVVRIDKKSVPYLSGFRKGDVIVEVNRRSVYAVGDFRSAVEAANPQQGVLLDVYRDNRFYYMTIEPGGVPRV
jgi:hypothetical protein